MRDVVNRASDLGGLLRYVLLLVAIATGFGGAGAAMGQVLTGEFTPKVYAVIDANGVDLAERNLTLSQSISIGDPANGGMSYSANYSTSWPANGLWRYFQSVAAYVRLDRIVHPETETEEYNWGLTINGRTEALSSLMDPEPGAPEGAVAEMVGELGSRVFLAGALNTAEAYVLSARLSDGAVLTFSPTPTSLQSGSPQPALIFRVTAAVKPNGERVSYHYGNGVWPSAISNSHGYQLRLEYAGGGGPERLASATLFNMAVDACDPDAASCPAFSRTWPRLTFEYQANFFGPTAIVQANGDRTTYSYAAVGRRRIEQVNGPGARSTIYTYQDCGTPPSGFQEPFGYCNTGTESLGGYRIATVSAGGRTWSYAWDPSLVQSPGFEYGTRVTSAAGSVGYRIGVTAWSTVLATTEVHLPAARVLAVTDELNRTTKMEYVGLLNPRTSKITYPEANGVEYAYDLRGNVTRVRTFAKAGGPPDQVVEIQRGEAGTTELCAQPAYCNKPILVRDARGYVTRNTWNATTGLLESTETGLQGPDANLTCALGAGLCPKTVYGYAPVNAYFKNGAGQLVAGPTIQALSTTSLCEAATTCAANTQIVTSLDYGPTGVANNLLVRSQSAGRAGLMATTSFSYDDVGNRTAVDGPRTDVADITRYAWDPIRRPTLETNADSSATRTTYNAEGYVESVATGTVSGGAFTALETTSYLYDLSGNQTRITTPAGVTEISYDGANRKLCTAVRMTPGALLDDACALAVPLASAETPDRISRIVYDKAGQTLQVRDAYATPLERAAATYSYTLNGKREYVIDANGNRSKWDYDGFDRLSKWTFPSTVRPSAYNPATQATALATAGVLNTNDYEQYTYDANHNRASLRKRDTRTIGYSYDALNRMTVKDLPTGDDVYYGYDLRGLQLYARFGSAATGAAGLTSTYDELGRMKTSSNNLGGTARQLSYEYDPAGNRTKLKFPDEQYVTFEYNAANGMTAIRENGVATITDLAYDSLGRRSGLSQGVATTYGYDPAGRLNTLSHGLAGDARDVTFAVPSYNAASQAMSKSISNDAYSWRDGVKVERTYRANGLNQYDLVGVAPYGYDANGNLTSDGATTYIYDVENRLISVGSTTLALAYDPQGRLSQTSGGSVGTTRFLYDGNALVAEYDGSGALLRRYVHGPGVDEPLVWYEGAGLATRRILRGDLQGSIVAVADAAGAEVATNTYDEYGLPGARNEGRFAYTGQIRIPEIGMYYYKARIYSPSLGRFLQTDPIGYEDGLNWYAYTGNDPLNRTDPTGNQAALRGALAPAVSPGPEVATSSDLYKLGGAIDDFIAKDNEQFRGSVGVLAREARSEGKKYERAWRSLERLITRSESRSERLEEQYVLVALRDGPYPDKDQGGLVDLKVGDVWKYGTSVDPATRYSDSALRGLGLGLFTETIGTASQVLVQERMQIIDYVNVHGRRPPGNPIYK